MARDRANRHVRRAQKLRRLSKSPNKNEAAAAAAAAQRIMLEYGLTEEMVGEASVEDVVEVADDKIDQLRAEVGRAVAFSKRCTLGASPAGEMCFRGQADAVKDARQLYRHLVDFADVAARSSLGGDPPEVAREAWRICWWFGYVAALSERLAPRSGNKGGDKGKPGDVSGAVADAARAIDELVTELAERVDDVAEAVERLRQRAYSSGKGSGEKMSATSPRSRHWERR